MNEPQPNPSTWRPSGSDAALAPLKATISKSDELLVQEAQHSPSAFAELYRRYFKAIYRYQMAKVGNLHDAQDLTAQTFLAAQESLAHYRHQDKFAAWLMTIAKRKSADHFRRRRPTVPLEMAEHLTQIASSAEDTLDRQLSLQQIAQALNRLTPDRAEAISLRLFGGFTAAEAAQMMGRSEAAFRMLVSRALDDLRLHLSPAQGED
ncbi:sigma-70 family RNA polymerase sigma factor [Pseudanabaena sp. FACHB-2040]|uniref:RNA polymerase sigma factor n=1 Tax=Pseudanabaena sp. FACHB-2040 TaxID=2692859 RepID=UPI00168918E6|nr:sigma-70 family RNA polymerase sigma factor [Pseudanabaena sp. FACHB-2040]MBD2256200.1 sigma-70 family RNA polymerase sigma factor [Pseudanabaena sp. FACHB-2040]